MKSKSGKSKYWGIQHNGLIARCTSKKQALYLEANLTVDTELSYLEYHPPYKGKPQTRWKLQFNGVCLGRIDKSHYVTLLVIKDTLNHEQQQYQSTSQPQCIRLQGSSGILPWSGQKQDSLLPTTPQRLQSSDAESGSVCGVGEIVLSMERESDFIQQLESIDRELKLKEQSDCEFTRRLAKVRRDQLEIALDQREIALDQREIALDQERIRREQQELNAILDDLISGNFKSIPRDSGAATERVRVEPKTQRKSGILETILHGLSHDTAQEIREGLEVYEKLKLTV